MGSPRHYSSALFFFLAASVSLASAADWPNFRGPDHNGISTERGWVADWPKPGPKQLWRASVGTGFASMSVSNGRVFTTGNEKDTDTIFCFDANTGRVLWKHSYPCPLAPKYNEGGTTATPTASGSDAFQLGKRGQLFCFDAPTGKVVWELNLVEELGVEVNEWGFASSPVIEGNLLLLNVGSAGSAVHRTTGKVVWTSGKEAAGYSSMVPFTADGVRYVAFMAKKALVIVEAKTGKEIARQSWETNYDTNCADPVMGGGGQLFISSYDRGGAVVKFADGKLTPGWKDWTMHNHINGSVLLKGHLYGINGQAGKTGDLRCVDFKTGEAKWVQPGVGIGSLMAADGKLIVLSEKGELIIALASAEGFKPLARAQVLGGKCWTSPVLSNGKIFCRNVRGDLVCLDVSAKPLN